eukprot:m.909308 g.909308  ORF g.909308 m.909308 type:complete len:226 (-) comp60108_c0_seq32:575-1252(-)
MSGFFLNPLESVVGVVFVAIAIGWSCCTCAALISTCTVSWSGCSSSWKVRRRSTGAPAGSCPLLTLIEGTDPSSDAKAGVTSTNILFVVTKLASRPVRKTHQKKKKRCVEKADRKRQDSEGKIRKVLSLAIPTDLTGHERLLGLDSVLEHRDILLQCRSFRRECLKGLHLLLGAFLALLLHIPCPIEEGIVVAVCILLALLLVQVLLLECALPVIEKVESRFLAK